MQQERRTTIRILIVDDSEAILNFMSRALSSSQGIEVIGSAHNGEEAVALAAGLRPDVIIMDVEMPIMGGLEATRAIKRAHPSIVVVLVSGSASLQTTCLSAGADGYIAKPFSAETLISGAMRNFSPDSTQ